MGEGQAVKLWASFAAPARKQLRLRVYGKKQINASYSEASQCKVGDILGVSQT